MKRKVLYILLNIIFNVILGNYENSTLRLYLTNITVWGPLLELLPPRPDPGLADEDEDDEDNIA